MAMDCLKPEYGNINIGSPKNNIKERSEFLLKRLTNNAKGYNERKAQINKKNCLLGKNNATILLKTV